MRDSRHALDTREDHLQSREGDALVQMMGGIERRIDATQDQLASSIASAVAQAMDGRMLSDDERQWVRLAIQREAQSIKLRQAIIEKTLTGLIWAGLVGVGLIFTEWLRAHGWK